jgi:hypothetical protein
MEISFTSIKSLIPTVITMLSMLVSGFFFLNNYLTANFVSVRDYDKTVTAGVIIGIENQKHIHENRLYLLNMCKELRSCPYKNSVNSEIDSALRDLQDSRNSLENYKRSQLR